LRNNLFRNRNKAVLSMSAAALTHECRDYVKQMALPLVPQRRVKGALQTVSRDSGVSYSKLRKIYYGLTDHILAFEFRSIANAYQKHVIAQERALERELELLRARKEAHQLRASHYELDLAAPEGALGANDGPHRQ
jgi:hypothetical protein